MKELTFKSWFKMQIVNGSCPYNLIGLYDNIRITPDIKFLSECKFEAKENKIYCLKGKRIYQVVNGDLK